MTDFAREYGEGLFLLAQEEHCEDELFQQLEELTQIFSQNPDYCRLLSNLSLSAEERRQILHRTFEGRVHPYLLNFLSILLKRGMLGEFALCGQKYRQLYYEAHRMTDATVYTPLPLSEEKLQALRARLESKSGCAVRIHQKIDPTLMGGVRVDLQGQTYDNTVAHRLTELHRTISHQE